MVQVCKINFLGPTELSCLQEKQKNPQNAAGQRTWNGLDRAQTLRRTMMRLAECTLLKRKDNNF